MEQNNQNQTNIFKFRNGELVTIIDKNATGKIISRTDFLNSPTPSYLILFEDQNGIPAMTSTALEYELEALD